MKMDDFSSEFIKKLPLAPEKDIVGWVRKKFKAFTENAIVYEKAKITDPLTGLSEDMAKCTCSACGSTFYQSIIKADACNGGYGYAPYGFYDENFEQVYHTNHCLCPNCHQPVTALYNNRINDTFRLSQNYHVLTVEKIDGCICLFWWIILKEVNKRAEAFVQVYPWEAYVFKGKKCYKFQKYYKYFNSENILPWWEQHECKDKIGKSGSKSVFPFRNDIFKGTELENAKFKKYMKDSGSNARPVSYLRTFQKYPAVENLVVQECTLYLNEMFGKYYSGYTEYGSIATFPKGAKKPHELLGLSKEDYRRMKREDWNYDEYFWSKIASEEGYFMDIDIVRSAVAGFRGGSDVMELLRQGIKPEKVVRYLTKQNIKYQPPVMMDYRFLKDYWNMAGEEHADMNDERIRFPQNLCGAHDQYVQLRNAREAARTAEAARRRAAQQMKNCAEAQEPFGKLAERFKDYEYHENGLFIRIAEKPEELVQEGMALNHCVGTYIQSHSEGDACIFFIRTEEEPDKPFYTLELDMKTLATLQNRGLRNCARTEEVEKFEKDWLEFIAGLNMRKAG